MKTTNYLDEGTRDNYIKMVSSQPSARVLDIVRGSGWLTFELARNGCDVDACDLSPKAIVLAKKILEENPFKEGFGSVSYHLDDGSEVDLVIEQCDAVSGW